MPAATEEYLVALDLGSATARCAIACHRPGRELSLEAYAERPAEGVDRGLILDAPAATAVVRAVVAGAAERAKLRVATILAAIATPYARGFNSRGCIGITHEDKVVRGPDAGHALVAANRVTLPSDRSVAEVLSQGFAVDDVRGIHNPVGIAGARLEAEVHVVTDLLAAHANVRQVVRAAGYRLEGVVFGPAAAAAAALTDEEKRLGAVHVDVGAGTTSLVLYAAGYPRFSRVLPVGSRHVTCDLAIGLDTSLDEAETLKRRPGLLAAKRPRHGADSPTIDVSRPDGSAVQTLPLWRAGVIARARVDELFDIVGRELARSGIPAAACARVVLTGGYCRMDGALDAARRGLRRHVRVATVDVATSLAQFEPDPTHAVILGSLLRGVVRREETLDRRFEEGGLRGLLRRVAGWF